MFQEPRMKLGAFSRLRTILICVVLLGLIQSPESAAQSIARLDPNDWEKLEESLRATSLDAVPDVTGAAQRWIEDLDATRIFLARNTSSTNFRDWMEYLDTEALAAALRDDGFPSQRKATTTAGREAIQLRYRLIGVAPGLELNVLQRLRKSTEVLIDSILYQNPEATLAAISKAFKELSGALPSIETKATARDFAAANQILQRLCSIGQENSKPAQSIRSHFSYPNASITVSSGPISSIIDRSVNESMPVRDCILGTRIVGTANLVGQVTGRLRPAIGFIQLQLSLNASLNSHNWGYNGPVRLRTVGTGTVNVTRLISVTSNRVSAGPVSTTANLSNRIVSIDHKLRLVRKIARRKAAEQKPAADRIALKKFREQVTQQFKSETDQASNLSIPNPADWLEPYLTRLDLDQPGFQIGSTSHEVFVDLTVARPGQVKSPTRKPSITSEHDAAVQIHETVINNLASPVLAGRKMTESELRGLADNISVHAESVPASLGHATGTSTETKPDSPFEITFHRDRPIVFESRGGKLRIGVRGTRFAQGGSVLSTELEIAASYIPARMLDGTWILVRNGDVEVNFPSRRGRRLSIEQTGLRASIKKKFAEVFPDSLLHRPLAIPANSPIAALASRRYRPSAIECQDGWLTVAVKQH